MSEVRVEKGPLAPRLWNQESEANAGAGSPGVHALTDVGSDEKPSDLPRAETRIEAGRSATVEVPVSGSRGGVAHNMFQPAPSTLVGKAKVSL